MLLSEISVDVPFSVARDARFTSLGKFTDAFPEMLVFVGAPRFLRFLKGHPTVGSVITTFELAPEVPHEMGLLTTSEPERLFFTLHSHLATQTSFYGSSKPSQIATSAKVHPSAVIAERDVVIGERSVIDAGVKIVGKVEIGNDVIVRAGTVLGSSGFEFRRLAGRIVPVPHVGGVRLRDRVEVQANCCIDCSTFGGYTELGEDTKLDNLVHVAHNVHIGPRTLIAAGATIAGAVTIGADVWIGPGAVISSELSIGDGANVTLGSVVVRDVPAREHVSGNFARDHKEFLRTLRR